MAEIVAGEEERYCLAMMVGGLAEEMMFPELRDSGLDDRRTVPLIGLSIGGTETELYDPRKEMF